MDTAKNREKGVAAVEFALILPLLLLVLFMIIEFSIVLYDKAVITNASREGARNGIVMQPAPRPTIAAITAVVNAYCASNLISFGTSAPATVVSAPCVSSGNLLTVNVSYKYNFLVIPNFIGSYASGLTLTGQTVMRCE